MTGLVDDLRFYNHALSEAEILELAVGPRASKPNPANGAIHSETSVELSWLAGPTAISHDVYFGTNEAAVTNADRNWPEYKGNQTGTTYPTSGLAEDTTYYWRIDEHSSDGTVTKGDVWSFSTTRFGVLWLDSTETIVAQPPGGAFYPRLLELANGDWLCGYDSPAMISKSTDKGRTWSYLSTASFGSGRAGNTQLTQLANGDVLCAYRLVNEPTKNLKVSRSVNNGRSWHHLSTIISNTEGVWEPHIIQKDDGQLLVFYAQEGGVGGNDQIIEMQRSDDNGATWHSPQTVSRQVGSRDGMPVPVILENGDIVVVLEGHNVMRDYQFVILSVRSSDGGDTWGSRRLVYAPEDRNHFAGAPYVVQMPTGEIVASFQTNDVPPGSEELEMGIVMSLDNGNTWISQPRPSSNEFGDHFMWNSLFVQDARTIVAATTCWGKIKIKKGMLYIQSPSPANGTTGVTQMPTLRWNAGDTDLQYDVYFGTDHTAVANANTTTPGIYRGRQTLMSYTPPEDLEAGQTYYWRIDEHNSDGTVTKGDVWSFSGYKDFSSSLSEDFETGDFDRFDWRSLGDADWTVTSDEYKSGTYSAQAGPIGNNGSTTLQLTLDCVSGEISLYYKVSSEQDYDYLGFYIDGSLQDEWSGNEDWTKVTYPVKAGTRTFEWTYSKDSSSSDGSDTAWIDNIEFPI